MLNVRSTVNYIKYSLCLLLLFSFPFSLITALQCTGRNPSQSAIENYWKKFGGMTCVMHNIIGILARIVKLKFDHFSSCQI